MKTGLVGFQGGGKSTVFELLTGTPPDPAKSHAGQVGLARVADETFDELVEQFAPAKISPARIELFDTPGLDRSVQAGNPQRLGIIREAAALVQVVGAFGEVDVLEEVERFDAELALADLEIIDNRIERLEVDAIKPRPDRDALQAELEGLRPMAAALEETGTLVGRELDKRQELSAKSFSLLTLRQRLVLVNIAEPAGDGDRETAAAITAAGHAVLLAPVGLELELDALEEDERAEFAAEMGLSGSCRHELMQAILEVADLITFYTCAEAEVHAWLLPRGSTAVEAAGLVHTDLARGFIRAEIMPTAKLLELGGEQAVKAAGLWHVEGKDYLIQDGDEVFIRSGV